jgi:hypothetical protein
MQTGIGRDPVDIKMGEKEGKQWRKLNRQTKQTETQQK